MINLQSSSYWNFISHFMLVTMSTIYMSPVNKHLYFDSEALDNNMDNYVLLIILTASKYF